MNLETTTNLGLVELGSLAPILCLATGVVLLMLSAALKRSHTPPCVITLLCLGAALVSTFCLASQVPFQVTDLMLVDGFSLFATQITLICMGVLTIFSHDYLGRHKENTEEFYMCLLLSALGAVVVMQSSHLLSFFLGIELLTIPLYALTAYFETRVRGLEAAVKYIVLASASAGFLLLGMAFIYAQTGVLRFDLIAERLLHAWDTGPFVLLLGFSFLLAGLAFKLSLAPFHLWTPDVYEGAPMPVTAYLATISKGSVVIWLLHFLTYVPPDAFPQLGGMLAILAVLSMFVGNFLALNQRNLKRIVAYSSIANMGYVLAAFLTDSSIRNEAILFYLSTYFVTLLLLAGALSLLHKGDEEVEHLEDLKGLFYTRPFMAVMLMLAALSLVGVPLTAGFLGKYFILMANVGSQQWLFVASLVLSSLLGVYAYLRIVVAVLQRPVEGETLDLHLSWHSSTLLVALMGVVLWLGILPNALLEIIQAYVM